MLNFQALPMWHLKPRVKEVGQGVPSSATWPTQSHQHRVSQTHPIDAKYIVPNPSRASVDQNITNVIPSKGSNNSFGLEPPLESQRVVTPSNLDQEIDFILNSFAKKPCTSTPRRDEDDFAQGNGCDQNSHLRSEIQPIASNPPNNSLISRENTQAHSLNFHSVMGESLKDVTANTLSRYQEGSEAPNLIRNNFQRSVSEGPFPHSSNFPKLHNFNQNITQIIGTRSDKSGFVKDAPYYNGVPIIPQSHSKRIPLVAVEHQINFEGVSSVTSHQQNPVGRKVNKTFAGQPHQEKSQTSLRGIVPGTRMENILPRAAPMKSLVNSNHEHVSDSMFEKLPPPNVVQLAATLSSMRPRKSFVKPSLSTGQNSRTLVQNQSQQRTVQNTENSNRENLNAVTRICSLQHEKVFYNIRTTNLKRSNSHFDFSSVITKRRKSQVTGRAIEHRRGKRSSLITSNLFDSGSADGKVSNLASNLVMNRPSSSSKALITTKHSRPVTKRLPGRRVANYAQQKNRISYLRKKLHEMLGRLDKHEELIDSTRGAEIRNKSLLPYQNSGLKLSQSQDGNLQRQLQNDNKGREMLVQRSIESVELKKPVGGLLANSLQKNIFGEGNVLPKDIAGISQYVINIYLNFY